MKKLLALLFILVIPISAHADIFEAPDQILFSTSVGTLHVIDSFLVSPSTNGVSVFVYDSVTGQYKFLKRQFISGFEPLNSKIESRKLLVHTTDNKIHFLSLDNLPEISYDGAIDLQIDIADYAFADSSLYIASYYKGILRYSVSNFNQASFVDSSMIGILVTQLSHDDQYLYALDEYNGLLRYEFNHVNFGQFVDYLYVPLRAKGFTQIDSLFYLHLIKGGLLVADFNQLDGESIVDSIFFYNQVTNLFSTDSLLITTDNRIIQVAEKYNNHDLYFYSLNGVEAEGLINPNTSFPSLMLPSSKGGLSYVTFDTAVVLSDGLDINGAISDILIENSKLFVSSNSEAINVFSIDTNGVTSFQNSLYENLNYSGQLANNGDSLFSIYPDIEKLTVIVNASSEDSAFIENSIPISSKAARDMHYTGEQLYDNALIFVEYPYQLDIYAVSDSGYLNYENEWNFISDMTTFSMKDSIVVLTNRKKECEVYQILPGYQNNLLTSFGLSGTATESIFYNQLLYLFQDEELYIVDFNDRNAIEVDTVLDLPFDVLDAIIIDDHMFTIGSKGIGKFDLSGALPEIVESGGLPGNSLAVDSNIIAIQDGSTLMLYYHDLPAKKPNDVQDNFNFTFLSQNYPNPFNLETVISYALPQSSNIKISVFNILGQKIKTLVDGYQDAGNHSVSWDGTNAGGDVIATGVYFYMLETSDLSISKKMILIK